MKKLLIIIVSLAFIGCASYQTCPTYSYKTLNKTTGVVSTNMSNVLYHKGDLVKQLPDGTVFEILEVSLTKSHY